MRARLVDGRIGQIKLKNTLIARIVGRRLKHTKERATND